MRSTVTVRVVVGRTVGFDGEGVPAPSLVGGASGSHPPCRGVGLARDLREEDRTAASRPAFPDSSAAAKTHGDARSTDRSRAAGERPSPNKNRGDAPPNRAGSQPSLEIRPSTGPQGRASDQHSTTPSIPTEKLSEPAKAYSRAPLFRPAFFATAARDRGPPPPDFASSAIRFFEAAQLQTGHAERS